jgi:hypothetical protein
MSRPAAPSMPTERQIKEAHEIVASLFPGARIKRVGPDGIEYDYPDTKGGDPKWSGQPFGADIT